MPLSMNSGWIRVHIYNDEEETSFEPLVKFPGFLASPPKIGDLIEGYTINGNSGVVIITEIIHSSFKNEDGSITPGFKVHTKRV